VAGADDVQSEIDFAALDVWSRCRQGGDQYDCVFDLTSAEKFELTTEFVSPAGRFATDVQAG
jgi:hypothetical protein